MPIQEDVIVNYIISDIHGAFNEFKQMLEKIEYNPDSDTMIVAGDVIDRGSDSIELLYYIKDFVDSGQMILLAGNHEFFCAEFIEGGLSVEKYAAFGGRANNCYVNTFLHAGKNNPQCCVYRKHRSIWKHWSCRWCFRKMYSSRTYFG